MSDSVSICPTITHMTKSPKKSNTSSRIRITVQLTRFIDEEIKALAKKDERKTSDYIRRVLAAHVNELKHA